jgi:hypothetical protein
MKLILIISILITQVFAQSETCSRVAVVNYQQVLVDSSASKPGEGLRHFLEKDSRSLSLLNEYQERSKPNWASAAVSSAGVLAMLGGLLSSGNSSGRESLVTRGAAVLLLNYLYRKTVQYQNQAILEQAVNEYNKRNLPRIYFSPYNDIDPSEPGVSVGITTEF